MRRMLPLLLLAALLAGCARPAKRAEQTVFAMDTVMTLTAYGDGAAAANTQAAQYLAALDACLSATRTDSDVAAINESGGAPVVVSDDTAAVLASALELGAQTGGAFQVSVYPLVQAWGFPTKDYRIPAQDALDALLPLVDDSAITLDGNTVTVPAGMAIDLGAIAKGYAGDKLMALYRDAGVTSAIVSLGGNVQALGVKPDGGKWRVGVQDPTGDGTAATLEIADCALVTSGGYERYFEEDGVRYWHILDPATGYPARSGVASATVIGTSGVRCDALSTALFVLGADKAEALWRELDGFDYLLLLDDGTVHLTEGIADCCTLCGAWEGAEATVIYR